MFFGGFFIFREEERISELIPNNAFEFIIATSEYVFRKPNKRIFELALEKAALLPEEVWYIGDNYECDIVGAKNAGMYPVWYLGARDIQAEKGDVLTVKDWETLKNVMLKQC